MAKRGLNIFFYNKKAFELSGQTIIYVLVALFLLLAFGWAVYSVAKRIFG